MEPSVPSISFNSQIEYYNQHRDSKHLTAFYSNISCWGPNAKPTIFSKSVIQNDIHAIVEHHLIETSAIKSMYKKHNKICYINPATPTGRSESGTHGGEYIAINKWIDSKPIPKHILDIIVATTGECIRFAACILHLKKKSIILCAVYFWCSGASAANKTIVSQLTCLKNVYGLSLYVMGDFNMKADELVDTTWLTELCVSPFLPDIETTFKPKPNSLIDYCLLSYDIQHICSVEPFLGTPWAHYALVYSISLRPREYQVTVLHKPTPLPMELFQPIWDSLQIEQQTKFYQDALCTAQTKLHLQKVRTGVAILGSPSDVLLNDPKFSGSGYPQAAIAAGEVLAEATLTSEILVCNVVGITNISRYIGRSQYPRFHKCSAAQTCQPGRAFSDKCEELNLFHAISTLCKFVKNSAPDNRDYALQSKVPTFVQLCEQANQFLATIDTMCLFGEFFFIDLPSVQNGDTSYILDLGIVIDTITNKLIQKMLADKADGWDKHVHSELAKGGGKLFQYIKRGEQSPFGMDFYTYNGANSHPHNFLNQEAAIWSNLWSPPTVDQVELGKIFCVLWDHVRTNTTAVNITHDSFINTCSKYSSSGRGSDNTDPKTLASLPTIATIPICNAINGSLSAHVLPHQALLNLVALLLKPLGGTRPITLTPFTYRIICKHAFSVQHWEESTDTVHESAGKGKSALAAALIRNITAEVTVGCGGFVGALLNDFEKFYDHIDISTLILQGIKHNFPLEWLVILIVQHTAPRVLKAGTILSQPIGVTSSIVAGCRCSLALTKLYLLEGVDSLRALEPKNNIYKHCDDIPITTKGSDRGCLKGSASLQLNMPILPKDGAKFCHTSPILTLLSIMPLQGLVNNYINLDVTMARSPVQRI